MKALHKSTSKHSYTKDLDQILISHVLWVGLVWIVVNTVSMCFLFVVNILLVIITVTCHYTHE